MDTNALSAAVEAHQRSAGPATDPLADIPDRPAAPDGEWRELIFQESMVIRPDECARLKRLFDQYVQRGHGRVRPNSRRIDRVWLGGLPRPPGMDENTIVPEGTEKIAYRLSALIQAHNFEHWRFDIPLYPKMCIPSSIVLDWNAAGPGKMAWHSDYTCEPSDRARNLEPKIFAIVQLSEPSEFEGGDLEIYTGRQTVRPKLEQGDMVLFPNFLLHRRHPVTRGARLTAVTMAFGPCWR
jgi:PKHD-type hydroxylase